MSSMYSKLLTIGLAVLIAACSKSSEDPAISNASANAVSESAEDSYNDDVDDLAGDTAGLDDTAITGRVNSNGRMERWADDRICENTVLKIWNAQDGNPDTLFIDFGATGCTDPKGNIRKGKIIIIYAVGSKRASHTITTENFSVNGVKVEGTRTVELLTGNLQGDGDITWEVTLVDGKLTFPDGTTATRATHHYRQWARNATPLNLLDDQIKVLASYDGDASTATGTNRRGYGYVTTIKADIVYKVSCLATKIFIPVAGTKEIIATKGNDTAIISIDYGSGDCDRKVKITINGQSKEENVSRDDNG